MDFYFSRFIILLLFYYQIIKEIMKIKKLFSFSMVVLLITTIISNVGAQVTPTMNSSLSTYVKGNVVTMKTDGIVSSANAVITTPVTYASSFMFTPDVVFGFKTYRGNFYYICRK